MQSYCHWRLTVLCTAGTPVLALTGGVVEAAGPFGSGYRTRVVLRHPATVQTLYAHLKPSLCRKVRR